MRMRAKSSNPPRSRAESLSRTGKTPNAASGFRRAALVAGLTALAVGCRETPGARAAQLKKVAATREQQVARRLAAAAADPTKEPPVAKWLMPPELREISGLTLTSRGTVLTHDDEIGRIYEIDPKAGIILKRFALTGLPHGDFEAIATTGTDVYLLESNGKIFRFKEGADGTEVPYVKYDTHLGKECEFESMAFETDSSRLVLVCKRVLTKGAPHDLVIYRFPLPLTDSTTPTLITVPMSEIAGSNDWKSFHASDMNIDPGTGNYVIVASHQRALAVITPDGDVVRSGPIPAAAEHNQAEGVAITKDNLLLISDEATHVPADLSVYPWRR
jgi:uncharacterized protein YjiK